MIDHNTFSHLSTRVTKIYSHDHIYDDIYSMMLWIEILTLYPFLKMSFF